MRFRIAQCLCPDRHAILAMALNDESVVDTDAVEMLRQSVQLLLHGRPEDRMSVGLPATEMNEWCGLCGAQWDTWTYEVCRSKEFSTWQEGIDVLREFETAQKITRALLDLLGVSYDRNREAREKHNRN